MPALSDGHPAALVPAVDRWTGATRSLTDGHAIRQSVLRRGGIRINFSTPASQW